MSSNVNTEANVGESTSANEVQIGSTSLPHLASASNSSSSVRKNANKLNKLISFWDTFEASVHNNESLSAIDKFDYLNSLLERSVTDTTAMFDGSVGEQYCCFLYRFFNTFVPSNSTGHGVQSSKARV